MHGLVSVTADIRDSVHPDFLAPHSLFNFFFYIWMYIKPSTLFTINFTSYFFFLQNLIFILLGKLCNMILFNFFFTVSAQDFCYLIIYFQFV